MKKIASTCRQLMLGRKEVSNAAVTVVLSGRREIHAAQLEPVHLCTHGICDLRASPTVSLTRHRHVSAAEIIAPGACVREQGQVVEAPCHVDLIQSPPGRDHEFVGVWSFQPLAFSDALCTCTASFGKRSCNLLRRL